MSGKIIYTNEQMQADLHEINRQMLHENFRPDVIVGIARGGLVPATMLSHYHGKPLMIINTSLRDNMVSQTSEIADFGATVVKGLRVLVVDDICDSGETLRKVIDEAATMFLSDIGTFEGAVKTAVLWNNTAQDVFEADYVGREINRLEDKRWVVFNYEEWWKV